MIAETRRPGRPRHSFSPIDLMSDSSEHASDNESLVTVAERADEMSATILVSVLEDAGIKAVATGGFTSGFRAEAPGMVKVQTFEKDAERAKQVISEIRPVQEGESPSE